MAKLTCQNCSQKFDSELIPGIINYLCPSCGFDNKPKAESAPPATPATPAIPAPTHYGPKKRIPFDAERKTRFWGSYFATLKEMFVGPTDFYKRYEIFQDSTSLFLFTYMNHLWSVLMGVIMHSLLMLGIGALILSQIEEELPLGLFGASFTLFYIFAVFLGPFLSMLMSIVISAVHHFFLKVIGGSTKPYGTTMNVHFAFSFFNAVSAPLSLFLIIPFLGSLVALALFAGMIVYLIFYQIIGMADVHEISGGKSFLSWAMIMITCCCLWMLPFLFFFVFLGEQISKMPIQ